MILFCHFLDAVWIKVATSQIYCVLKKDGLAFNNYKQQEKSIVFSEVLTRSNNRHHKVLKYFSKNQESLQIKM